MTFVATSLIECFLFFGCSPLWHLYILLSISFFFFNDTATTEIYTLSLHDALPISKETYNKFQDDDGCPDTVSESSVVDSDNDGINDVRSEEHTSELQSHHDLVCRLLLEKKKQQD